MAEKLVDKLTANPFFNDRQKIITSMFPGILFGFVPPNFDQMIERIDCAVCGEILVILGSMLKIFEAIDLKARELSKPVSDKNEALKRKCQAWRRIPVMGRFVKDPVYKPLPDFTNEPWYLKQKVQIEDLHRQLQACRQRDVPHWEDEKNEVISQEFTSMYFQKDCWVVAGGGTIIHNGG